MRAEGGNRRNTTYTYSGKGKRTAKKAKSREIPKMNLPNFQVYLGTDPRPPIATWEVRRPHAGSAVISSAHTATFLVGDTLNSRALTITHIISPPLQKA